MIWLKIKQDSSDSIHLNLVSQYCHICGEYHKCQRHVMVVMNVCQYQAEFMDNIIEQLDKCRGVKELICKKKLLCILKTKL